MSNTFTEGLAQRRGCLTFEPLEAVGVGLWHLCGQAGEVQSGEKTCGITNIPLSISNLSRSHSIRSIYGQAGEHLHCLCKTERE